MKKIAIITITNSGLNFGNRLQNYALQHVSERYSVQVLSIYSAKSIFGNIWLSRLRRIAKILLKSSLRRRCFNYFDKKHIKKAKRIRYEGINEKSFSGEYDAFIAGSDQIWNPNFHFNSGFEFLDFADPAKRYSYAASFGVSQVPEKHREEYSNRLKSLNRISVREEQGREIVKHISGRDAPVHLDPTMLLDAEHYATLEEKPRHPLPDKYLLTYFLGKIPPEYNAFIKESAEQSELQVVELSESPDSAFYNCGPQHFLYLIRHAEYICADSFHGIVFSILFKKRFTVFSRSDSAASMDSGSDSAVSMNSGIDNTASMNSRIDTLLNKFGMESRIFGNLSVDESMKNIPYDQVEKHLSREREAAEKYLREIVESL